MSEYKFTSPVYNVLRVPIEKIKANDYNPNSVAPPERAKSHSPERSD